MRTIVIALGLLLPALAAAATPSPAARAEIAQLLDHLQASGCEFNRNGRWYLAPAAREHLQKKFEYLLDKGLVGSSEDFIERAASRSSVSGQPYQVRCSSTAPVASADWLKTALRQLRQRAATSR